MGSSKKPAQATSQNITTTTLPAYSRPYFEDVLARTQGEANRPYQTYGGQRTAGFTDAERQSQQGIMGLTTPGQFGAATQMATEAGNYTPGQFDGGYDQAQFTGGNYGAGQFDGGYNPTQFTGGDYATGQFNGGYDPTQFTGGNYATGQFGADSFNDSGNASQFMSPYMQNVVDVQKQSAIRDAKQGQLAGNLGAARQGTYGGSRQLLANMERERNLGTQLGSIQATGLQSAYEAAQKQFGSEQDRRMQAQQYGEQSRQFGGSQSMEAQRQAELSRQFGANFGMDAQKQREASRQFGSTRQLQAQQEQERAKQFGANFGMDAQRQAEQSRQFGATQRTQAEQAAAAERQFGANYRMDAQRQAEQSRQYAGNQRLSAAQALGQFGTAQQQADMQRLNAQNAVGETQRGLEQTRLDTAYGDFQRQRDYPMDQLGRYANIVQGLPNTSNTTATQYAQAPSALAGLAGTAAAAYGGYKTFAAAGGEMRSYNNGGLVALAEGGVGSGSGGEDSVFKLRDDPKELLYSTGGDPTKLQTALQQGADPAAVAYAAMLAERIKGASAMAPQQTTIAGLLNPPQQGLGAIAPQGQPPMDPMQAQQPQPMMAANGGLMNINLPDDYYDEDSYAHGGIAHFDEGGTTPRVYRTTTTSAEDKRKILETRLKQAQKDGDTETFNRIIEQLQELNAPPEDSTEFVSDVKGLGRSVKDAFTPSDFTKGFIGSSVDYFTKTPKQRKETEDAYFASLGVTPGTSIATPTAATQPAATVTPAGIPQPSAPQGLAQLQEVDMSTMPTRREAPVDYMAKAKELYAGVPSGGMTDEEMAKDKEQRKYEALMQFGLNLAGTKNSSFLGGVGEAGAATMPAIIEARTSQNEAKAARRKEDRDMKVAQIQTALGLEKDDAEKVFKQQELALKKQEGLDRSKLTAAQINNLNQVDNIYEMSLRNPEAAKELVAIQNAKDLTPNAKIQGLIALLNNADAKDRPTIQQAIMELAQGGSGDTNATEEESGVLRRYGLQ